MSMDIQTYLGCLNIGINPTVDSANVDTKIEIHILDFDENIYDHEYFLRID